MLALRFHPDREDIKSTEVFQRIAEAYRVLSDATAGAAYDQRLHAAESTRFGRSGAAPRGAETGRRLRPGGQNHLAARGPRRSHRVDDLIIGCAARWTPWSRAVARRCDDGAVELRLLATEALQGGTAAIDTSVEIVCPTCLGGTPSRLWCIRCEHAGRVRET